MKLEEILIIRNGDESYGISTANINQIARVPMLMELPLRPNGVRGLCAVSGSIVSMVDMNILLGLDEVNYAKDKSRILILNDNLSHSALLVSEVYNTVEVDDKNLEYLDNDDDPIIAIYKYKKSLVQILSLDILFEKIKSVHIESKEVHSGKPKVDVISEEETNRFLIFAMAKEKFAIHIDYLREIILADVTFTDIAGSAEEILGLITLRDELVVVLDFRKYYGFNAKFGPKNRILIASYDGKKIGLLVDEILDIKNYSSKDIEPMSDEHNDRKISGVIHEKKSLISYFDQSVLEKIFEENESFVDAKSGESGESEIAKDVAMEVIVFKLDKKEYAFKVENVAEIIDFVQSTDVAYTNDGIDGIINMRGQIITIVSLYKRLNLKSVITDDSKIVICEIDGVKIGFVVDSVSDILEIKQNEIREQSEEELFNNVLHLEKGKRLVLSMDLDKILAS